MPATPSEVSTNMMEQMTIHSQPVQFFRVMVDITSKKARTEIEIDSNGMNCQIDAKCLVSGEIMVLTQSGDAAGLQEFMSLRENDSLIAICSCDSTSNESTKPKFLVRCFHPLDKDEKDTYLKAFTFEYKQVQSYVKKRKPSTETEFQTPRKLETPDMLHKLDASSPCQTQFFLSPKRARHKTPEEVASLETQKQEPEVRQDMGKLLEAM